VYASAALLCRGGACRHLPLGQLPGDHCAVAAEAGGAAERWRGARPLWRLPLSLLADDELGRRVRAELADCQAGRGAFWSALPPGGAAGGAVGAAAGAASAAAAAGAGAQAPGADAAERWEALKGRLARLARAREAELRRERRAREAQAASAVRAAAAAHAAAVAASAPAAAVSAAAARVRAEAARLAGRREASTAEDDARGEALWHRYGEQPTFWFHRLGRGAQAPAPPMRAINDPSAGRPVTADTLAGSLRGAALVADHFDGDRGGVFAPRPTNAAARSLMLAAVDKQLTPEQAGPCEGPAGDSLIRRSAA
jgi:hypothetical protein